VGTALLAVVAGAIAHAADGEGDRIRDTGRFYLYVDNGHAFQLDDEVVSDVEIDIPGGFNHVLGGGMGYNLTDHWGFEVQAHGTEPDLRSDTLRKVKELSNITLMGAVRYRYPIGDGRLVPYVTAGVGLSYSDINDTGNLRVKTTMDERSIAGSLALGAEYFVAENVSFGVVMQSFHYPKAEIEHTVRDAANRVILNEKGEIDLSSVSLLAQIRLYPGQAWRPATRDKPARDRTFLFATEGPFDTDDVRVYLYALGGHTFVFDEDFGGGIEIEAPGAFNATLGGGVGLNVSRHWGAELHFAHTEPNLSRSRDVGKFAEMSNLTVLPTVRFRWPCGAGRWVPFATAGFGVSFNNINDVRQTADVFQAGSVNTPIARIDEMSIAGAVGIGLEYFLNHHITFGVAVPYYIYPDLDTLVQERSATGARLGFERSSVNLSGLAPMIRVTAYMP
jgi:opacity protein-like surface antigen